MTQEEFDRTFNIYRPTEQDLDALFGEDRPTAVKTLTNMLHKASTQATTIASHLIAHELQQLKSQLNPALQFVQERQMEQMKTRFFKQNPDLEGLEPLLVLIRDQMVAQGRQFGTEDEAFKAVAEEARKHMEAIPGLKTAKPGQGAAQAAQGQSQNQQQSGQPARRMPALSGGQGQSGAGDSSASSGGKRMNAAQRIFG
jgi:hypothetical protein